MRACSPDPPRPRSKNAGWEEPPAENEPFDYNAQPSRFYFDLETVGSLEPDVVVQQGIKVLQQKLALVIGDLTGSEVDGVNGNAAGADLDGFGGPKSPELDGGDYDPEQGFPTYGAGAGDGGGGASAWGGGATPYGATPYGQNGWA